MLVETKARVGVFAIALGAYLPQFPTLVPEFEQQYADFKKTIPDTVEIVDGGIVTTKELSMAAGDKFRAADVDLVILQLLTYATSYNMLPAVRDLNVPVVLVNVQKKKAPDYANTDTPTWLGELYACGAVGEMVADLERAGKRHAVITGVVEGGDPQVQAEIEDWCRAAQVRRRFRDTNLAQIGRPYPGMMDLYIDETNLYNRMFLYTKQFDWEKMWAIADNITDEAAIRTKAQDILDTFDIEGGGTIEKVWDMAKYVVAFEQWVKDEKIAFIASHYDGFAQGKAGVLDMAKISANTLGQFDDRYTIFSLPYLFKGQEHYYNAMANSQVIRELFNATEDAGYIAIGYYCNGARNFYLKDDVAVTSPAVLKGKKIRSMVSSTSMDMIEAMGGSPVPMSASETYTSLQQGIVDGAENTELALTVDKHEEIVKSYTYTEHQYTPDIYIISTKVWNKLSKEQQDYLLECFSKLNDNFVQKYNQMMDDAITEAESYGVHVYRDIDKTPFIEAVQPIHQNFLAKGDAYQRLYDDIQSYAEDTSK